VGIAHLLKGCRTGECRWSKGHDLPARYPLRSLSDILFMSRFLFYTVSPKYNEKYRVAAENALHRYSNVQNRP
jgi:hypothetical protein